MFVCLKSEGVDKHTVSYSLQVENVDDKKGKWSKMSVLCCELPAVTDWLFWSVLTIMIEGCKMWPLSRAWVVKSDALIQFYGQCCVGRVGKDTLANTANSQITFWLQCFWLVSVQWWWCWGNAQWQLLNGDEGKVGKRKTKREREKVQTRQTASWPVASGRPLTVQFWVTENGNERNGERGHCWNRGDGRERPNWHGHGRCWLPAACCFLQRLARPLFFTADFALFLLFFFFNFPSFSLLWLYKRASTSIFFASTAAFSVGNFASCLREKGEGACSLSLSHSLPIGSTADQNDLRTETVPPVCLCVCLL